MFILNLDLFEHVEFVQSLPYICIFDRAGYFLLFLAILIHFLEEWFTVLILFFIPPWLIIFLIVWRFLILLNVFVYDVYRWSWSSIFF